MPESQSWVNASVAKKPLIDWREYVIRGMHYSGGLGLARRIGESFELRPGSSLMFPRFRRIQNPKFVILCYHGIGESGNPLGAAPTVEIFEAQMRFLRENYRIVSLDELCGELNNGNGSEPGIAITFDDGYRSTYTLAFPVLKKYRLPATVYLTLDSVETGQVAWYDRVFLAMAVPPSGELQLDLEGPWRFQLNSPEDRLRAAFEVVAHLRTLPNCRRRECCSLLEKRIGLPQNALSGRVLTWEQIRTMHQAGISFGSHTLTHPVVSQLSQSELESELGDSKRVLEDKLGDAVKDFAFPFGKASDYSHAAIQMLTRCGYRSAVTTVPGVNTPELNPYELRRLQVGCDGSLARFAFNLCQTTLRTEESHSLIGPSTDTLQATKETGPKTSGVSLGDPDA
jgi:peptidoglycan/xylan/chitin deacetylase (PgdA/CDA1 family)